MPMIEWTPPQPPRPSHVEAAATKLGAVPADIVGLWWLPGRVDVPELTTGQLLDLASRG